MRGRQGTQTKVEREWTGEYEREGYNKMEFLIQVEVFLLKDLSIDVDDDTISDRFGMKVVKCTQRPVLEGQEWWSTTKQGTRRSSFPWLASRIFPDTHLDDWR